MSELKDFKVICDEGSTQPVLENQEQLYVEPTEGFKVWGEKTLANGESALTRMNLRLLMMKAPKVKSDGKHCTVISYMGTTYTIRHRRRKVKNKRVFNLYKLLLAHFGKLITRGRMDTIIKVVCDHTNNSEQDKRDGRMNVDIHINPPLELAEMPVAMVMEKVAVSPVEGQEISTEYQTQYELEMQNPEPDINHQSIDLMDEMLQDIGDGEYGIMTAEPCCHCGCVDRGPTEEVCLAGAIPVNDTCQYYKPRGA